MLDHRKTFWGLIACTALGLTVRAGQPATERGEWRSYGGDVFSTKYSPLDQINAGNFAQLEIAWRWKSADEFLIRAAEGGERRAKAEVVFEELQKENPNRWRGKLPPRIGNFKATPLMVNGVLYVATALSQAAAINAATGETLWVHDPKSYESGTPTMSIFWNHRGVAYWENGDDKRILWGTGDGYLIAVDAKTGKPVPQFGEAGRVDLYKDLPRADRNARDYLNAMLYSCSSPPIVCRDVVVTGSSIADRRITKESIPGDVRGWDVRTGKLKWSFHTVPREGEFGTDTWQNESWKYSGNSNVWTVMSADEELGYVYLPTGTGTNDYYGADRLGNNLFAESLICVNVENGERVWHFQTVHHGLWDYDNPAAPNLLNITINGKSIKAVAQVTKQGFCYVFNRMTGEPIWPIEERPVPPSTIPGEVASPTQPFPTKPAPFEAQGVELNDLIDFTPEIREMAVKAVADFRIGPVFTPPSLTDSAGKGATLIRPSAAGGANWTGAAVDPETGWLYVPSYNSIFYVGFYEPNSGDGGTVRYTHGGPVARPAMPDNLPLIKPPYSRMTAINLNTGEHAWMKPLGNGDEIRNHKLLKDLNLPPLGGDRFSGPVLTKTLLIAAQSAGRSEGSSRLVARDKKTGEVVAEVKLPASELGTPMTYMMNGRQYIALTINSRVPELIAFALPAEKKP